jgi:hypothetical protein
MFMTRVRTKLHVPLVVHYLRSQTEESSGSRTEFVFWHENGSTDIFIVNCTWIQRTGSDRVLFPALGKATG